MDPTVATRRSRRYRQAIILSSVIAKAVALCVLLPLVPARLRVVFSLIFVAAIATQSLLFVRLSRRNR